MATQTAFLWQGFDHEWLRAVLGFRLPHRISRLESYIDAEDGDTAEFHFGQATGVDGNYMKPVGHFAAIRADGLRVLRGVATFRWTDALEAVSGEVRCARSVQTRAIEPSIAGERGTVVLRGLRLRASAPGMWPYRFSIDLGEADVTVNIERGWTPNKGGVPGIEQKPLTEQLDFELDVAYTVLAGDADVLAVTRGDVAVAHNEARSTEFARAVTVIAGSTDARFPVAAVGITGFGFELLPPSDSKRHQHRGRYIGGVGFRATLEDYNPRSGLATIEQRARVWVPVTVVRSDARYHLQTVLIQLGGAGAAATKSLQARGSLCAESSPEAPFFSHWKRCGGTKTGPARTRDTAHIRATYSSC